MRCIDSYISVKKLVPVTIQGFSSVLLCFSAVPRIMGHKNFSILYPPSINNIKKKLVTEQTSWNSCQKTYYFFKSIQPALYLYWSILRYDKWNVKGVTRSDQQFHPHQHQLHSSSPGCCDAFKHVAGSFLYDNTSSTMSQHSIGGPPTDVLDLLQSTPALLIEIKASHGPKSEKTSEKCRLFQKSTLCSVLLDMAALFIYSFKNYCIRPSPLRSMSVLGSSVGCWFTPDFEKKKTIDK